MSRELLAIFGPTGVGKTGLALALARRLRDRGERPVAVSADALQLYAGLPILTGAADAAEQQQLEHRLVGVLPVTETCSAARYARLAHAEIDAILADGGTPIVVGGTGLYLRAALADLDLAPAPPPGLRERLLDRVAREGLPALHAELTRVAPERAAAVDPRDTTRVVRSLELHAMGALPQRTGESELWTARTRHPTRLVALVMEREALYAQIDARVDAMVAAGAAREVRDADAAGASATARRAIGFDALLDGDVDRMKAQTRRYAKRQLTWLRKLPGTEVVDVTGRAAADVAAQLLP
ncbi:tRNA (adenosine(37)-N6)-dimethylallyltransferase MiaA [Conexibacter sp. W3-3-2]|uniref:tRNA dimethylallyltransferase n=1 Tax=Paraconexibacter algicola TaxID=2133960 RepID=A0A2T4UCI1_9ACTN|nr:MULTISPECIES: tRNA (adenosine(37)-N6)-dimethylallyltransferase MiaA [Solirubrobacterales]MTD43189.1 tRNA (adenosine(37)-N6)-dimethylallyltransferase MiaA [Conexibacter sp. W3-3-2]PTL54938.1 tRNA (adenosine(37)-N6)-dimethylallyltransferase MiaA [Paraconexibacter algicola]